MQDTIATLKVISQFFVFIFQKLFTKDYRYRWHWRDVIQTFLHGTVFTDLSSAARKILEDERVNTVIFGHSHVYSYRLFEDDKEYFNTGTWTVGTSLDFNIFGRFTKLTFVLIEYGEGISNRPICRIKEWRGYHRIEEDVSVL